MSKFTYFSDTPSLDSILQLIFLSVHLFESLDLNYNVLSFTTNHWFNQFSALDKTKLLMYILDLIELNSSTSSYFIQDRFHSQTYYLIFNSPTSTPIRHPGGTI